MPEKALKHTYIARSNSWTKQVVRVEVDPRSFAEGCLRKAHKMWEYDERGGRIAFVAKFPKVRVQGGPATHREHFFNDVKTQMVAEAIAQEFNKRKPLKKVAFLPAYVLELCERPGSPCCCVEPLLEGNYLKHNNNDGDIGTSRETPQAFSHFSYEHSKRQLLVCDIQGVADFYTDPQIHSYDGRGYGLGNMGKEGISKFLSTHRCNAECGRVGVAPVKPPVPPDPLGFSGGSWGVGARDRPQQPKHRGPYPVQRGNQEIGGRGGGGRQAAADRGGKQIAPNKADKGPSTRLAEKIAREEAHKWQARDEQLARHLSKQEFKRR